MFVQVYIMMSPIAAQDGGPLDTTVTVADQASGVTVTRNWVGQKSKATPKIMRIVPNDTVPC